MSWPAGAPLRESPTIERCTVHVWFTSLDEPPVAEEQLWEVLTLSERRTADRYRFEHGRRRSIASRGLLRHLLGTYLRVRPEDVQLQVGPNGKPEISGNSSHKLQFNVAHSEDVALYVVTPQSHIGVDVECMRNIADALDVSKRFFAQVESDALHQVPPDLRDGRFLTCWTRKEAFVKALGSGLSVPLDEFVVGFEPLTGRGELEIPANPEEAARWSVHDLRPRPEVIAALVIAEPDARLQCWTWC